MIRKNDTPLVPSTVNVKMAAVRSLVHCAAAEGWISEHDEEQILNRVKSRPVAGRREGSACRSQTCSAASAFWTARPWRASATMPCSGCSLPAGCAGAELCDLDAKTIGRLNEGWALIDLAGKRQKGALDSAGAADQAGN
jgi:hypothetical protein